MGVASKSLLFLGAMDVALGRLRIAVSEALTLDSLLLEFQLTTNSAMIFNRSVGE